MKLLFVVLSGSRLCNWYGACTVEICIVLCETEEGSA